MEEIKKSVYTSRVLNAVGRLSQQTLLELATRAEVLRVTGLKEGELDEILEDLKGRGLIETGRTINGTYIKLAK